MNAQGVVLVAGSEVDLDISVGVAGQESIIARAEPTGAVAGFIHANEGGRPCAVELIQVEFAR